MEEKVCKFLSIQNQSSQTNPICVGEEKGMDHHHKYHMTKVEKMLHYKEIKEQGKGAKGLKGVLLLLYNLRQRGIKTLNIDHCQKVNLSKI